MTVLLHGHGRRDVDLGEFKLLLRLDLLDLARSPPEEEQDEDAVDGDGGGGGLGVLLGRHAVDDRDGLRFEDQGRELGREEDVADIAPQGGEYAGLTLEAGWRAEGGVYACAKCGTGAPGIVFR